MSAETTIYKDLTPAQLIEQALSRGAGQLADTGALVVTTGRSPGDRYIVQEPSTSDSIDWTSVNRPFDAAKFDALWDRVEDYLADHESFVSNLHVGAHEDHYIPVVVNTQTAWQGLFGRNMFVRPSKYNPKGKDDWTVLIYVGFVCEP